MKKQVQALGAYVLRNGVGVTMAVFAVAVLAMGAPAWAVDPATIDGTAMISGVKTELQNQFPTIAAAAAGIIGSFMILRWGWNAIRRGVR